jgi:hypothetical protein
MHGFDYSVKMIGSLFLPREKADLVHPIWVIDCGLKSLSEKR